MAEIGCDYYTPKNALYIQEKLLTMISLILIGIFVFFFIAHQFVLKKVLENYRFKGDHYVFDADLLHEIAKNTKGDTKEELFKGIHDELKVSTHSLIHFCCKTIECFGFRLIVPSFLSNSRENTPNIYGTRGSGYGSTLEDGYALNDTV